MQDSSRCSATPSTARCSSTNTSHSRPASLHVESGSIRFPCWSSTLFLSLSSMTSALGLLMAPHGFSYYLRRHVLDQTFKGLYRWNAFDTSMLVPYFIVMLILAFYGIHRYQLVWLYYRNKKNAAKW